MALGVRARNGASPAARHRLQRSSGAGRTRSLLQLHLARARTVQGGTIRRPEPPGAARRNLLGVVLQGRAAQEVQRAGETVGRGSRAGPRAGNAVAPPSRRPGILSRSVPVVVPVMMVM